MAFTMAGVSLGVKLDQHGANEGRPAAPPAHQASGPGRQASRATRAGDPRRA
jgi:hypothetical protein